MRALHVVLISVGLVASACGTDGESSRGESIPATTTEQLTTPTQPASTTSGLPPTTSEPSSTTTLGPSETSTRTGPVVVGWSGEGPYRICTEAAFTFDLADAARQDQPEAVLHGLLQDLFLEVAEDECDATLTLDLEGSGLAGDYADLGTRYTGAAVSGSLSLSAPEQPTITVPVEGSYGPEGAVATTDRRVDESDAPFGAALEPALLPVLVEVWGPNAASALVEQFGIDRDRDVPTTETALRLLADIGPPALDAPGRIPIAVRIAQLYNKSINDDWFRLLGIDDLVLAALRAVSEQDLGENPDAWLTWAHGDSGAPSLEEQLEAVLLDSLVKSGFTDEEAQCLLDEIGFDPLFAGDVEASALTPASDTCGISLDRLAFLSR